MLAITDRGAVASGEHGGGLVEVKREQERELSVVALPSPRQGLLFQLIGHMLDG